MTSLSFIAHGRLALLPVLFAVLFGIAACGERGASAPPNIVLITVDTLRADHLSPYGYARNTSPALARLAQEGVLFEQARSQSPWTLPSMASLHTSMYPSQHGADKAGRSISEELPVLAEVLRAAGYRTIGFVTHLFVSAPFGFGRGFDEFEFLATGGHQGSTSAELTAAALAELDAENAAPVFLWVHYFDPHYSYVRHPEYDFATKRRGKARLEAPIHFGALVSKDGTSDLSRFDEKDLAFVEGVYDEEVAHTDHWIGELIEGARTRLEGRPTVFVVSADHGELFAEHGRFGHGRDVYDALIRVPLVIGGDVDPGWKGRRVERPVEVASIARTLMGIAGIEDHGFRGEDLLAEDDAASRGQAIFFEGGDAWRDDFDKVGVVHAGLKLIHDLERDRFELYDLAQDPDETRDLWPTHAERPEALALRGRLDDFRTRALRADTSKVDLSEAEREQLRQLGYIDGTDEDAEAAAEGEAH